MRAEEHGLEPVDRRIARREMRDRLDAREALDRDTRHQAAHAGTRSWVVVHVDELRLPRVAHGPRSREKRLSVRAERWVELHRHDELAALEKLLQPRRLFHRHGSDLQLAPAEEEGGSRLRVLVDRGPDRRDPRRRRPAAPADDPGTERACLRRKFPKYAGVACGKTMRCPDKLASPTFGSAASGTPTSAMSAMAP